MQIKELKDRISGSEGKILSALGINSTGTCIVAAQPEQAARPKKMMKPVGKNQTVVYDAIRELIAKEGQMLPATSEILAPVKAVLLEHVIDKATPKVVGDTAAKKRGRIQEAITSMQDKGVVSVLDPWPGIVCCLVVPLL